MLEAEAIAGKANLEGIYVDTGKKGEAEEEPTLFGPACGAGHGYPLYI